MYYRKLQPIRDKLRYSDELARVLGQELWQLVYKPLVDLLSPEVRHNAEVGDRIRIVTARTSGSKAYDIKVTEKKGGNKYKGVILEGYLAGTEVVGDERVVENAKAPALIQAFLERKIWYADGFVYGKFNAQISRELRLLGATFNASKRIFKLPLSQIPPEIRSAIARGGIVEQGAVEAMRKKLEELSAQAIMVPAADRISRDTLEDLHAQFERVTPADLQIPVEMNAEMERQIRRDYTESIHLEINNLSQEMTERLRYRVEEAVGQGMRAEDLKGILMSEHGVAASRCKFVARSETALFTAKYRQTRYEDAGIRLYQWSTSNDERVRPMHRELNGQIFSFDDPPVTNPKGEHNNPGEDWGPCRCVALPVFLQPGKKFTKGMEEGNLLETTEHKALHAGGR